MRKLIRNKWFLGAIAFLALALLIWFVGEGIAIFDFHPFASPWARAILIALVALTWLGIELLALFRARRANQKLLEGIAGGEAAAVDPAAGRSADEVAALKKRFDEAAATLKKAKFKDGGSGQLLYQLPWYVFIGAPGSGKTTALVNCGLRFPLADGGTAQAVRGVGGTRNCDWWFAEDAVFLDTAGRYTTQESDAKVDSAAWLGFLDLVRKSRPKRPLNGAIVTLSISDLLAWSDQERTRYAAAVKTRVQELYERLGVRFPLYLMVTKSDLMAGFNEFFSDIGREERDQVWGMTFPFKRGGTEAADFAQEFKGEFKALESRLNLRLTDRLQAERDLQRRALVYNFPQQMSLIGPLVASFIDEAFRASRFDEQAMLRGVYFTSGTQEGTPIDRVLGALSRSLNLERRMLPPSSASGKSYFLTRLLREVVFPEAGLTGLNEKRERLSRWLVRGAYVAIALVSVGLLAAFAASYANNSQLVKDVQTRVAALKESVARLPPPRADDIAAVLPVFNDLRDLPYGYAQRKDSPPLGMRFGLFQGEKLGEQERAVYRSVLRDAYLPRYAMRLEAQIRKPANDELLYESLKNYLMLFDDKHLDPQALEDWMVADWGRLLPRDATGLSRQDLASHLQAALSRRPMAIKYERDDDLIAKARVKLAEASLPERILSRIKLLGVDPAVPPFKLSEAAGAAASQVFTRASGLPLSDPFPALFTYDGYHKGFLAQVEKVAGQMAAEENWVLGEQASSRGSGSYSGAQLVAEVKRRYLEEYKRRWDELLADLQLRGSASMADTILYSRVLSGIDSPLRKLAVGVARETALAPRAEEPKALTEKAAEAVAGLTQKAVNKLLGGASPEAPAGKSPESLVDDHFEPLRRLATPAAPGGPMPLDKIIAMLGDFNLELSAAETTIRGGGALVPTLPSGTKLKAEADGLPPPLRSVLLALVTATSGQAASANQQAIKKAIGGAASFCETAVDRKYPISRRAKTDATADDFATVFAPGGDLDQFFTKELQPLVDTSGRQWRVRPGAEATIPVSAAAIRQFQNADVIRHAFFRGGQPTATADLVLLSADVGTVTLEYDGDTFAFSPAKPAARIKWPSLKPAPSAKLYLSAAGSQIVTDGDWAMFKLFDRADVAAGSSPQRKKLSFTLDGKKVVFELRATSVFNPFFLPELSAFSCPS